MNAAAKNRNSMSNSHQPLALPSVVIGLVVVPWAIIRALAVVAPLAVVVRRAIASMLIVASALVITVAVVVHLCEGGGSRQPAPPNQHVRERAAFDASAHEAPPTCTRRDAEMQRYCAG